VLLLALLLALTLGNTGDSGRSFVVDLAQADVNWLGSALLGGIVFNLSNILLVAAIDIAGMAVAFPVGIGLALILGVVTTYRATALGDVTMLAAGVSGVTVAILLDALAYRRLASTSQRAPARGIVLSIVAGILMGWFYSFVAQSMAASDPVTQQLTPGKLTPYTALLFFSLRLFLSNFIWNSIAMKKPFRGEPVACRDYLKRAMRGCMPSEFWEA
jgi:glucose uptake protein